MNKNLHFLLLPLLLSLSSVTLAGDLAAAEAALAEGRFSAVLEALKGLPQAQAQSYRVRFLKASALAGSGRDEEARPLFETLIAQEPARPEAYNELAALLAAEGRLEEARRLLEQGLGTNPTYARLYRNLNQVLVEKARNAYAKALNHGRPRPMPPLDAFRSPARSGEAVQEPALSTVLPKREQGGADKPALSRTGPSEPAPPADGASSGDQTLQGLYGEALVRLQSRLESRPEDYEAGLLKGLLLFKAGRLKEALAVLNHLSRHAPRFHLAHLVRGDLTLAQAQSVTDIGHTPLLDRPEWRREELERLRHEAQVRMGAFLEAMPQGRLPRALLALGPSIENALVVDKHHHRLYHYRWDPEADLPLLVRDYYVSTGKLKGNKRVVGDLRTPEGVYFITRHIPGKRLPEKYGVSAYPLNYPNELDRHLGKSGYGIWLHGTDSAFYSRPPRDSEGCVVLPNLDLSGLDGVLEPGVTPVVVAARVTWLEEGQWRALRKEALEALEAWRRDWAGGDVERYLSHYARDFWSGQHDLRSWSRHKRKIAAGKTFQEVALSGVSLFAYPGEAAGERPVVVANFQQDYTSNNHSSETAKRLYLVKGEGRWQVLYEGSQ